MLAFICCVVKWIGRHDSLMSEKSVFAAFMWTKLNLVLLVSKELNTSYFAYNIAAVVDLLTCLCVCAIKHIYVCLHLALFKTRHLSVYIYQVR